MADQPAAPGSDDDTNWVEQLLTYARHDWVTFGSTERLHHAVELVADVTDWCFRDVVTACGLRREQAWIPGIFTRMAAPRCAHCCDESGYPRGVGSPKNDDLCREILGLAPSRSASVDSTVESDVVDDGNDVFGGGNLTACGATGCGCQQSEDAC